MQCEVCGHANVTGAEACVECGAPLGKAATLLHPGETFRDPDDLRFGEEGTPPADTEDARPPEQPAQTAAPQAPRRRVFDADPLPLPARAQRAEQERELLQTMADRLRPRRPAAPAEIRYAGFFRRLVAFAIDALVLALFTVPLAIAGWAGMRTGLSILGMPWPIETAEAFGSLLSTGWTAMALVYFTLLHRGGGQTIGKAAVGVHVRTLSLAPLGLGRSLVRVLGYLLSSTFLGLGFLTIAVSRRKRGWHDYLAGTCVVRLAPGEG